MSTMPIERRVRKLLEEPFWLPTLTTMKTYTRLHDDHDGTFEGKLSVIVAPDGDIHVTIDKHPGRSLRFRMFGGGGQSMRTRTALLMLAEAIRLDNADHPQQIPGEQDEESNDHP